MCCFFSEIVFCMTLAVVYKMFSYFKSVSALTKNKISYLETTDFTVCPLKSLPAKFKNE